MKRKILVIDDNPTVILTVKVGLNDLSAEYEVIPAISGDAGLEFLEKGELPDLILLDIMMPVMDGWEVHRKIKENQVWRKIPIIFLTAVADKTSKKVGQIAAADFIEKPFDILDLKNRIDAVLKT
jgi:CheY-like chemotaxis protein